MENLQPLIIESAQLLLIGMGTVFVILIMMIFLINLASRLLPEDPVAPTAGTSRKVQSKPVANDANELIAVIGSAIKAYRNKRAP